MVLIVLQSYGVLAHLIFFLKLYTIFLKNQLEFFAAIMAPEATACACKLPNLMSKKSS